MLHLRTSSDTDETVRFSLDTCIRICKVATGLEKLLGISRKDAGFSYTLKHPKTRWQAVKQGKRLAMMERKRLGLGTLPVRNIVEIIARLGVRVG